MGLSSRLADILAEFREKFGYELVKWNKDLDYWKFERIVNGSNTHVLILEDNRWELGLEDFDPKKDIGDWLIFSELVDDERGWLGNYVETQYPLTYSEYKLIEKIIHELERRDEQKNSGSGEESSTEKAAGREQSEEPGYFDGYRYGK